MPLSINVGLNRKASVDYQSTGASINITAELDATLLTRPDELQDKIARLYSYARIALDRQAAVPAPAPAHSPATQRRLPPPAGHNAKPSNGNGPAPMTPKQRSAILAIGRRADVDVRSSAMATFGTEFDRLSTRQASAMIDNLKAGAN